MQRHAAAFEHRAALPRRQRSVGIEHHIEANSIGIGIEGVIVNDLPDAERQRFVAPEPRYNCRRSLRRASSQSAPQYDQPRQDSP